MLGICPQIIGKKSPHFLNSPNQKMPNNAQSKLYLNVQNFFIKPLLKSQNIHKIACFETVPSV
jgi:hypothetical protein